MADLINNDPNELKTNLEKLQRGLPLRKTIPVEIRIKELKNLRDGLKSH